MSKQKAKKESAPLPLDKSRTLGFADFKIQALILVIIGFVFYTNYLSEKGLHLEKNLRAGLVIHWKELERQIRIDGISEKVSREESARYFHSRPLGSQLGAWVSHQSDVIDARRILEARLSELEERFAGQEIPCPPYWGGYRVKPERIEFWQGRPNRLHDRFRYTRQGESWRIERLAP